LYILAFAENTALREKENTARQRVVPTNESDGVAALESGIWPGAGT
jgi:hypothetical protein